VASAFAELQRLCGENHVIGLISTGWKEAGKTRNQIRIVDAEGHLAGQYAKTCLCYGEADWTAGGFPMVHTVGGLKVGTLICNNLWVTPGFSDGPNPHLSRSVARAGAQVIFHAVNSGSDQRFRAYHESNLTVRAAEANCPIVVVNAYSPPAINASSGVVGTQFRYVSSLPRDREMIQTVEFTLAGVSGSCGAEILGRTRPARWIFPRMLPSLPGDRRGMGLVSCRLESPVTRGRVSGRHFRLARWSPDPAPLGLDRPDHRLGSHLFPRRDAGHQLGRY
jgi:hypothetical protein